MRAVDATLLAALQSGAPLPYLKAYVGYANGTVKNSHTNVRAYRLTGTTLEFWIPTVTNFGSDQECIWLERGLQINGTNYTITTGRFFIWEEEYLPDSVTRFKGGIVPPEYYSDPGDVTYHVAIDTFFAEYGKTVTFMNPAEAWIEYQFLPAGQMIIINNAVRFFNLLHQKRLIRVCDNGGEDVRVYSADVLGASLATVTVEDEFSVSTTKTRSRQYIWRDELETVHQDGDPTDPIHNLGYLEAADTCPARNFQTLEAVAYIRPDLRFQDGDSITLSMYKGTKSAGIFAKVTEEYDSKASKLPRWRLKLEADPIFETTEGGAMPSTIERVSNYTPLNTSHFDNFLSSSENNLQAAMDRLDDHDHLIFAPDTNDVYRNNACSSSAFAGTIASLPGGASITYNLVSGAADAMICSGPANNAKMRLYNTTRGNYARIISCVVATTTITFDTNVPVDWQIGDVITILSPTLGFNAVSWVELEITAGLLVARDKCILTLLYKDSTVANTQFRAQPYEAPHPCKMHSWWCQVANQYVGSQFDLKIVDDVICIGWSASGAGTAAVIVKQIAYDL